MGNELRLSHADERGQVRMVDISGKRTSERVAVARGRVRMSRAAAAALQSVHNKKGDVLATVRVAGISAAKQTSNLIPLCHQVALAGCELLIGEPQEEGEETVIELTARAVAKDATGVEMEALTAVSVAALTLYDMLKAVDRSLTIEQIALESKRGGQRGDYQRHSQTEAGVGEI